MISIYAPIVGVALACARPEPLAWYYRFLLWLETKGSVGQFVSKMIGGCPECTSGQIALWWSIGTHLTVAEVITNVSTAILLGDVLTKIYAWSKS